MSPKDSVVEFLLKIIRLAKRRDAKGIGVCLITLVLALISALSTLGKDLIPHMGWVMSGLAALLLLLLLFLITKIWREPLLIESVKRDDLPKSVRGLEPFNENDGPFFQHLYRSGEIDELVKHARDPRYPLVLLCGAPGSGKTSVLHAGLMYQLAPDIPTVHLEMADGCTVQECENLIVQLRALHPPDAATPAPWPDGRLAVIVLDRFEQIQLINPNHKEILQWLKERCNHPDSFRLKFVIAYQEQYQALWREAQNKFEIVDSSAEHLPVTLGPLKPESAKEIMATILYGAGVIVDDAPLDRYVWSVAVDRRVSPVEIGYGTSGFHTWAKRADLQRIQLNHYTKAGGTTGILGAHFDRVVDAFVNPLDRTSLLTALSDTLVEKGLRKPEGEALQAISDRSRIPSHTLKRYLDHLSGPEARVLEQVPGNHEAEAYRLIHERWAPVLKRCSGEAISDKERMDSRLKEQYQRWRQTKRWRDLLSIWDLFPMLHHKSQLANPPDRLGWRRYILTSWYFAAALVATAVLAVLLLSFGLRVLTLHRFVERQEARLKVWGLPPDLYMRQDQLDMLEIEGLPVSDLAWLRSPRLQEINISSHDWESIQGVSALPALQTVTLDITRSKADSLNELSMMQQLTTLKLYLGQSGVQNLSALRNLKSLTGITLFLSGSKIHDVSDLAGVPSLRIVELDLQPPSAVEGISTLSQITDLYLNLEGADVRQLPDLAGLVSLRRLRINLKDSQIQNLAGVFSLQQLRELDLNLEGCASIRSLPDISLLRNLEVLRLNLDDTRLGLPNGMTDLANLKDLSLVLTTASVHELSDVSVFRHLDTVDISLGPDIETLPGLDQSTIKTLKLRFNPARAPDISHLDHLRNLRNLSLDIRSLDQTHLPDLTQLRHIPNLALSLTLEWPQLRILPDLASLTGLNTLALSLSGGLRENTSVQELSRLTRLSSLRNLTLHLQNSVIATLPDFSAELNVLDLDLADSHINDLSKVSHLEKLTTLTLTLDGTLELLHLPEFNALGDLQTLSLSLDRSKIKTIPDLISTKKLQTLVLTLPNSEVQTLPDLGQLRFLKSVTLDLRHTPIVDLSQLGKLAALDDLTLDRGFPLLRDMPKTVRKLHFHW